VLSSVGIDDTWSAGLFGFYRDKGTSATQSFDNLDNLKDSALDGGRGRPPLHRGLRCLAFW